MRKDLSDSDRRGLVQSAECWVADLHEDGQSLALARECWINAFDKAAEELENTDGQEQA